MYSIFRAFILAAGFSAGLAQAQNIPYDFTATVITWDPAFQVNGTFTDGDTLPGGQIVDYASGLLEITGSDSSGSFTFNALCVEPTDAFPGPLLYKGADLSGVPNYQQVAKLVGGYLQNVGSAVDPGLETAAVQWAIWEVVADTSGTYSLSQDAGNVYVIPGGISGDHPDTDLQVITRANQYLAAMNSFNSANLVYLTSVGNQDVVTWNIPEPGTAGLLALSVLGFLRRRR